MITEYEFFKIWKDTCKDKETDLVDAWNKNYTNVILGRNNSESIMNKIKEKLNNIGGQKSDDVWELHQEYYSSDVIFYREENRINENPFSKINSEWGKSPSRFSGVYLKHIDIHLEHENNIKKSWEEIIQLQNVPGDLNVLVTYPMTEKDNEITQVSESLAQIIFNKNEFHLLVIFGNKDNTQINWQGYLLKNGKLEEIK